MAEQNQEFNEIMQQVNYEMQRYGKLTGATADALRDAEVGVKGFSDALRTGPKAVVDATTSMASAMYKGEKGAAAFNKSIDGMAQAADSAITVLMAMIPGGPAIKAVVAGLGFLAKALIKTAAEVDKAANEQGDALYNTYQKLGKAGVVAAGGTTQLGKDLYKLGLSFTEAESMVTLFSENSQDLALFGKTAFQGADAMTNIVNSAKPYRESLQRLGLSQAEQNEAIMGYIKVQTRLGNAGRLQAQGYEATAAAANKYIVEQDALTKVTGISRKEQEKALEEAMRNQRYAATIDQLIAEGKTEEAENLRVMVQASGRLGPQFQKGITDLVSGFANTDEARQVLLATQGDALKQIDLVKTGISKAPGEIDKSMQSIFNNTAQFNKNMRPLAQAGAYDKTFGSFAEQRKAQELTGDAFVEGMDEARKATKKQVDGEDKRLKNQSKTIVAQQDATLATQQLVDMAITPATTATLALAEAAKLAAEKLLEIANGGKTRAQEKAGQSLTQAKATDEKAIGDLQSAMDKRKEVEASKTATKEEKEAARTAEERALRESKMAELEKAEAALREKNMRQKLAKAQNIARQQGKPIPQTAEEAGLVAPKGASSTAAPASGGSASAAGGGEAKKTAEGLKLKGGQGGQATAGGESTEGLYALAHSIQGAVGDNLEYFSGLNDAARANDKNSKHSAGKALDVVLKDPEKYPSVLAMIKGMPNVKFAQFERAGQKNANGSTASGDHIHAEVSAANGAILSGPRSGYQPNLTMHGTEAIVPLPDGKSIPVSTPGMGSSEMQQSFSNAVADMTGALMDALSEMIREQKNTNSINQKLLQAARN